MESTDFESPIHLIRQLRWPGNLTANMKGLFHERRRLTGPGEYCDIDHIINALDKCEDCLGKITNLVEELGLSGRGFPVSLRMEIEDQLGTYNSFWSSNRINGECAASTLGTLRKIYDDLSLHACVDLKHNVSTLELILADNAMIELVELASMLDCRGVQSSPSSAGTSPYIRMTIGQVSRLSYARR